jgi:hypothetical protein
MAVGDDKTTPPPSASTLHLATTVTNIKNHIPLVLDTDEGNYNNWTALFRVQCIVCNVLDHIKSEQGIVFVIVCET